MRYLPFIHKEQTNLTAPQAGCKKSNSIVKSIAGYIHARFLCFMPTCIFGITAFLLTRAVQASARLRRKKMGDGHPDYLNTSKAVLTLDQLLLWR